MAKRVSYNVKTKTTTIEDFEFVERVKTAEELEQEYQQRVVELIGQQYSQADELGLTNDNMLEIMAGQPALQVYIDYRNYVESCKDTAHMEVFGIERA